MDGYLFDASALSAYLSPQHQFHATAKARIDALPPGALRLVSVITLAEMDYGIRLAEQARSTRLDEYRQRLSVVRRYAQLDLTHHTGEVYAELKARIAGHVLRKAGKKLPRWLEDWIESGSEKRLQVDENDLWLCAQSKERDLILVTGDTDIRNINAIDPDVRILLTRD